MTTSRLHLFCFFFFKEWFAVYKKTSWHARKTGGIMKNMVLKTAALALLIAGSVVVGGSGITHLGMDGMAMHETMPGCPLMGMSTICQMNPLQHLGMWQNLFAFVPTAESLLALLLSLVAAALGLRLFSRILILISKIRLRQLLPREYDPPPRLLQELFSSGILNPKLF